MNEPFYLNPENPVADMLDYMRYYLCYNESPVFDDLLQWTGQVLTGEMSSIVYIYTPISGVTNLFMSFLCDYVLESRACVDLTSDNLILLDAGIDLIHFRNVSINKVRSFIRRQWAVDRTKKIYIQRHYIISSPVIEDDIGGCLYLELRPRSTPGDLPIMTTKGADVFTDYIMSLSK